MDKRQHIILFLTFLVCTACLILLTLSLTTNKWIVVRPVRLSVMTINSSSSSSTDSPSSQSLPSSLHSPSSPSSSSSGSAYVNDEDDSNKFHGNIYFGLLKGTKILNYGFGDRVSHIWIKDELLLRNPTLMNFGLWLFTILCVAIAMIFGVVSIIFAIINTIMTPIEIISGPQGLYLWNGMGALFCTGACVSWIVQFRTKLRRNVLTPEEIHDGWSSEARARLGLSFFMVVAALFLFLLNILLISLSSRRPSSKSSQKKVDPSPEGVIMLY